LIENIKDANREIERLKREVERLRLHENEMIQRYIRENERQREALSQLHDHMHQLLEIERETPK
jgi:signal transduction protein with GAF and PtsI domain